MTSPPSLAVLTDLPEEGWPSMDLVAEMLLRHLAGSDVVRATRVCAPFKRRLSFLGGPGRNADRLANRMWHYPRFLRRRAGDFDAFHLCDHSYAQLVHELPGDRTGVLLHDLDTFRCLFEPDQEPRPRWFRAMARRILAGLRRANVVFYLTTAIREQIERLGVVDPAKLVRTPVAAAPEFTYRKSPAHPGVALASSQARQCSPATPPQDQPYLLHVGSCIPRKRIDVLLQTFAAARHPDLNLVQVGGDWTPAQRDLIDRLHLAPAITQLRNLSRDTIADLYRRAALVLQPSDAEGFGLPVVEALACGAPVVASDIPVLREVGGDAALYCPVGDVDRWGDTVSKLLTNQFAPPALDARLAQAAKFSWAEHARVVAATYRDLLGVTAAGAA